MEKTWLAHEEVRNPQNLMGFILGGCEIEGEKEAKVIKSPLAILWIKGRTEHRYKHL
jgi:hypothetical protein